MDKGVSDVEREEMFLAVSAAVFDRVLRVSGNRSDVPWLQLPADGPDRGDRHDGAGIFAAARYVEAAASGADAHRGGGDHRSGAGGGGVFSGGTGNPHVGLRRGVDEPVPESDLLPVQYVLVSFVRCGNPFCRRGGLLPSGVGPAAGVPGVSLGIFFSEIWWEVRGDG